MHPHEMWFPIDGSDKVVGRFRDLEQDITQQNGEKKTFSRPGLEARVAGNSNDISFQLMKDFNKDMLIKRCPLGWAHYEKYKAAPVEETVRPITDHGGIKGTPLEKMGAFNNERISWFHAQGIYTVEQLAAISDTTLGNLGMGARGWRKKAADFLKAGAMAA